jgi:Holliday junction resolvasome RuvABC endonuclease subunit
VVILGLDISTATTGWCVTKKEESITILVATGFVHHNKKKTLHEKAKEVSAVIEQLVNDKVFIDKVCIEENLQSFRAGLSSARTLMTLARYNGIVSHECWLATGLIPEYYNVNRARKVLGINTSKKARLPNEKAKDVVHRWVKAHSMMTKFDWPTKVLKAGPNRGKTIEDPGCKDISDAFVISLCGHIEHFD